MSILLYIRHVILHCPLNINICLKKQRSVCSVHESLLGGKHGESYYLYWLEQCIICPYFLGTYNSETRHCCVDTAAKHP